MARENTRAGRGAYYPSVSAGFSASREQDPPGALAAVPSNNAFLYNLFTPQVSVSYVPDVFGLNRRNVESLKAQEQAVRFQMIATRITLSSNVVAGSGSAGFAACADCRDPRADRDQREDGEASCATSSTRAMRAGWISPRRNRSSPSCSPRCRRC